MDDKLTAARKIYAEYGERATRQRGQEPDKQWILQVLAGEADETHGVQIALAALNSAAP